MITNPLIASYSNGGLPRNSHTIYKYDYKIEHKHKHSESRFIGLIFRRIRFMEQTDIYLKV